jgi:hypothetical protein
MPPTTQVAPLALIRFALMASVVMFGVAIAVTHRPPILDPASKQAAILGYAVIAYAFASILVAFVRRGRIAGEANEPRRRGLLIMSWAISESAGLLGGVAYMLTGQWPSYAIGLAATLVGMMLSPP